MNEKPAHVVTGAFGFSGKYIARRLLKEGFSVRTLTNKNSPLRKEGGFGGRMEVFPLDFTHPEELVSAFRGAAVLYNTYWVRFNHRCFSFAQAVRNSKTLFTAAKEAGVRRVVHVSITNPSEDSPFVYFRGKAQVERALRESGLSYAVLRPAVLFGDEGILLHNIAWTLRRFPIFGLFGDGNYRLRPVHVEDLAKLAVEQGRRDENVVLDAVGPENFRYRDLLDCVAEAIGVRRPMVRVPVILGWTVAKVMGLFLHDVLLTREEIGGLMAGLLDSEAPATGETKLSDWVKENADALGRRYQSELARRRPARRAG